MALNSTSLIRYIERKLGASHHILELTTENILDTIYDETLPLFSTYFPYFYEMKISPTEDKVEGHEGQYWIKTDLDVIGVSKLLVNNFESNQAPLGAYYQDPFSQAIVNTMQTMTTCPTTYRYIFPNKIEIYPKNLYYKDLLIQVKAIHPKHFQTIPTTLQEQFKLLAYYDICLSLFPIRGRFTNINTSIGNIDLFMNQLEDAQSKRDELLEKWDRNYLKSSRRKKLFIY